MTRQEVSLFWEKSKENNIRKRVVIFYLYYNLNIPIKEILCIFDYKNKQSYYAVYNIVKKMPYDLQFCETSKKIYNELCTK